MTDIVMTLCHDRTCVSPEKPLLELSDSVKAQCTCVGPEEPVLALSDSVKAQ